MGWEGQGGGTAVRSRRIPTNTLSTNSHISLYTHSLRCLPGNNFGDEEGTTSSAENLTWPMDSCAISEQELANELEINSDKMSFET
jgi:hypothetical protein